MTKNVFYSQAMQWKYVEVICEGAFYGCSALENISFADDVRIDDWAFSKTPYAPMNP